MQRRLKTIGKKLFRRLVELGYIGYVGFDLIITTEGVIYPVECNARCTAAMFAQAVHIRTGHSGITFSGSFIVPKGTNYEIAQIYVDEIPLEKDELFLLHNVRCLPDGEGSAIVQAKDMKRIRKIITALTCKLNLSSYKELVAIN
jgi:hypothetical protein